jgi:hypothetical protein
VEGLSGFRRAIASDVLVWAGEPDCNAAHAALLQSLNDLGISFIGGSTSITLSQRGNLGEFAAFHIACSGQFSTMEKFARNALQPLSGISGAGLDLTYVYFDGASDKGDLLYIQEVKTTCAENLNYFDHLTVDYKKLFATDINLTLQTRIQCLANSFELERNNDAYAQRVQQLAAKTPQMCDRVRLIPTGIHDIEVGNPTPKMVAIRSAITAFGWDPTAISPWAIGLSDLEDRLLRLARGQL